MTVPSYPINELPPNHKALVELALSLKVDKLVVVDDIVAISYSDRNRPITVELNNVSSNSRKSDGTP